MSRGAVEGVQEEAGNHRVPATLVVCSGAVVIGKALAVGGALGTMAATSEDSINARTVKFFDVIPYQ